jgi:hypothetical protein
MGQVFSALGGAVLAKVHSFRCNPVQSLHAVAGSVPLWAEGATAPAGNCTCVHAGWYRNIEARARVASVAAQIAACHSQHQCHHVLR